MSKADTAIALSGTRERFAQAIVSGMTAADAYRKVYNVKPSTSDKSIWEAASHLKDDHKVAARIDQLLAPAVESAELSAAAHLDELKRLRDIALTNGNDAAAIRAEELRGKVAQLYVTRVETGEPGAFDKLAATAKAAGMDALLAEIAKRHALALGVTDVQVKE